jgi:hypothetical protein
MNQKIIDICEQRALGQYLSVWPEDKSYAEIVEALKNDTNIEDENGYNMIEIWDPMEGQWYISIAVMIEYEKASLLRFVDNILNNIGDHIL